PVVERPLEIGDRQLDRAHPRCGRNLHAFDYPCVCLSCASFACASASESAPEHTCAFSSFSILSTSAARGYGSGQRLRGSVGSPPSSRLMKWSSWYADGRPVWPYSRSCRSLSSFV